MSTNQFYYKSMFSGLPVNIKKVNSGAFRYVAGSKKRRSTKNNRIMVCERGASFGYNNLVSDIQACRF